MTDANADLYATTLAILDAGGSPPPTSSEPQPEEPRAEEPDTEALELGAAASEAAAGPGTGAVVGGRPGGRVMLDVPFSDNAAAKAAGCRWDRKARAWWTTAYEPSMARWLPLPDILPGEDRSAGDGLFVDLIPTSCWFTNARSCLAPTDWERVRAMVTRRAGQRCEVCAAERDADLHRWLEVHERWAYDEDTGVQRLVRLICLCTDCHLTTHYGFAEVVGRDEQAFAHLMRVRACDRDAADAHIEEATALWQQRSARTWELDLRVLTDAGVTVAAPPAPQVRADVAETTLRHQPPTREDRRSGPPPRSAPARREEPYGHWDLVEPSDYVTAYDLQDWVDLDDPGDSAADDPDTAPTPADEPAPAGSVSPADVAAADVAADVFEADVFESDDDTWLHSATATAPPVTAVLPPRTLTAGIGADVAAATPPRYNRGLVLAFTAATALVAIAVTSVLLGMRSTPAIDTGFQAGSETQISVVAAAVPEADPTALDTPIPFMATATCPAGSTPAQSVAGDDPSRAWVCVRGGTDGQVLTLQLGRPMLITALSITPGWVGTDANGVDQWPSHRVVSRVQWIFDNDPTTVMTQTTGNIRGEAVQPVPGRGVLASTITMIVLQTSRPPADVAPTTAAPGGGLLGGVLPPVPAETFPAPRFGGADTRPDPVDSTFAVSSIKVLGHTPE